MNSHVAVRSRAVRTVIPSEASRRVRSCGRVGLRREESLFSFVRVISALCVSSSSSFFLPTHYPLLTTHFLSLFP
jgi:hypothetical protein